MKLTEIEKRALFFQETKRNMPLFVHKRKTIFYSGFGWFIKAFLAKKVLALAVLASLFTFSLTAFLFPVHVIYAQGLGLTGNFSRFGFELKQGEASAGTEAYIIVINNSQSSMRVKIDTKTPQDVAILVPEKDFVLEPGGNKRLDVVVQVGKKAVPGDYEISISAVPFNEGGGIKVSSGSAQRATLKVLKSGMSPFVIAGIVVGGLIILGVLVWLLVLRRR